MAELKPFTDEELKEWKQCYPIMTAEYERGVPRFLATIAADRKRIEELAEACQLAVLNFKRSERFLDDDDHEAWTALESALKKAEVNDD